MKAQRSTSAEFLSAFLPPALVGTTLAASALLLGPESAVFALLLNAFIMSQVAGSLQVKSFAVPSSFHRLRGVERDGRIYVYFGIRLFKRLMTSRLYLALNPAFNLRSRSQTGDLESNLCSAEAAHLLVCALMLLTSAIALSLGSLRAALWLLLFNVAGNAYPVMLQRYNRGRLRRLQERMAERR